MRGPLPLVSLSVLRPLLAGLLERGVAPEPVLESVGLTERAIFSDGATVHVMVVHQFLENAAAAVADKTFAASIGMRMDPSGWPMIEEAQARARSLGDFLNIYVSGANQVASSVTAFLEVRGSLAIFGETRRFRPTIEPAQNDGFMISLALSILKLGLGKEFDPTQVNLVVCDPNALPDELRSMNPLRGDVMGFRIQFPSVWLSTPIADTSIAKRTNERPAHVFADEDFMTGLRKILRQNVGAGPMNAQRMAELTAMSPSKLARRLSAHGARITSEIERAKIEYAKDRLKNSNDSVGDVAAALGYADPANFARAFRRTTGVSPTEWRKENKATKHNL